MLRGHSYDGEEAASPRSLDNSPPRDRHGLVTSAHHDQAVPNVPDRVIPSPSPPPSPVPPKSLPLILSQLRSTVLDLVASQRVTTDSQWAPYLTGDRTLKFRPQQHSTLGQDEASSRSKSKIVETAVSMEHSLLESGLLDELVAIARGAASKLSSSNTCDAAPLQTNWEKVQQRVDCCFSWALATVLLRSVTSQSTAPTAARFKNVTTFQAMDVVEQTSTLLTRCLEESIEMWEGSCAQCQGSGGGDVGDTSSSSMELIWVLFSTLFIVLGCPHAEHWELMPSVAVDRSASFSSCFVGCHCVASQSMNASYAPFATSILMDAGLLSLLISIVFSRPGVPQPRREVTWVQCLTLKLLGSLFAVASKSEVDVIASLLPQQGTDADCADGTLSTVLLVHLLDHVKVAATSPYAVRALTALLLHEGLSLPSLDMRCTTSVALNRLTDDLLTMPLPSSQCSPPRRAATFSAKKGVKAGTAEMAEDCSELCIPQSIHESSALFILCLLIEQHKHFPCAESNDGEDVAEERGAVNWRQLWHRRCEELLLSTCTAKQLLHHPHFNAALNVGVVLMHRLLDIEVEGRGNVKCADLMQRASAIIRCDRGVSTPARLIGVITPNFQVLSVATAPWTTKVQRSFQIALSEPTEAVATMPVDGALSPHATHTSRFTASPSLVITADCASHADSGACLHAVWAAPTDNSGAIGHCVCVIEVPLKHVPDGSSPPPARMAFQASQQPKKDEAVRATDLMKASNAQLTPSVYCAPRELFLVPSASLMLQNGGGSSLRVWSINGSQGSPLCSQDLIPDGSLITPRMRRTCQEVTLLHYGDEASNRIDGYVGVCTKGTTRVAVWARRKEGSPSEGSPKRVSRHDEQGFSLPPRRGYCLVAQAFGSSRLLSLASDVVSTDDDQRSNTEASVAPPEPHRNNEDVPATEGNDDEGDEKFKNKGTSTGGHEAEINALTAALRLQQQMYEALTGRYTAVEQQRDDLMNRLVDMRSETEILLSSVVKPLRDELTKSRAVIMERDNELATAHMAMGIMLQHNQQLAKQLAMTRQLLEAKLSQ